MNVKRLPIFGELQLLRERADEIRLLAREPGPARSTAELCRYLREGHPLEDWMGLESCVLDPSHDVVESLATLTDSTWVWREDTAHYVAEHGILLPEPFTRHAESLSFRVPELTPETLDALRAELRDQDLGPSVG